MKKLTVLAALVLLLVVGCSKKADYWPLTVGNTWDYTGTAITTHSDTLLNPDTTTGTMNMEITSEVTLTNGDPAFQQIMTQTFGSYTSAETSYVAEVGDYVLSYGALSDTDPDTMIVNPLEAGASWTVESDSGYTQKAYVIAQEDLTVPADTYNDAWKILWVSVDGATVDTTTVYFAPNVGLVKMMMTESNPMDTTTTNITIELEDVNIK